MGALKNQMALFNFEEVCPIPDEDCSNFPAGNREVLDNGGRFVKVSEISYITSSAHKNRLANTSKEVEMAIVKSIGIYLKLIEFKEKSWNEFYYSKPETYDWLLKVELYFLGISYLKSVMHSKGLDTERFSNIESYDEAKRVFFKNFGEDFDETYHELI